MVVKIENTCAYPGYPNKENMLHTVQLPKYTIDFPKTKEIMNQTATNELLESIYLIFTIFYI